MRKSLTFASLLTTCALCHLASAENNYYYWGPNHNESNPGTGDWTNGSYWTLDGFHAANATPGSSDEATIDAGTVVVGSSDPAINTLEVTFNSDSGSSPPTVANYGSFTAASITSNQIPSGYFDQDGGTANVGSIDIGQIAGSKTNAVGLVINGGTFKNSTASGVQNSVTSLSISGSGTLNLRQNQLTIDYGLIGALIQNLPSRVGWRAAITVAYGRAQA